MDALRLQGGHRPRSVTENYLDYPLDANSGDTRKAGTIEAGELADIIILKSDPVADISVPQGGQNLVMVIKDGRIVDLDGQGSEEDRLVLETVSS